MKNPQNSSASQKGIKNPLEKKKERKRKKFDQIRSLIPRRNSSIDRKGSRGGGEKFGKNIFFPLPTPPMSSDCSARQSGRTRKHKRTRTSLNKSAQYGTSQSPWEWTLGFTFKDNGDPTTHRQRVHRLMHCLLFALRTNGRAQRDLNLTVRGHGPRGTPPLPRHQTSAFRNNSTKLHSPRAPLLIPSSSLSSSHYSSVSTGVLRSADPVEF